MYLRFPLYSYIDKGIFLHLTRKHLPVKKTPQKAHKPPMRSRAPKGETIERKAREVKARCSVGHWEMDTVKSGKGGRAALLVLTERLTRRQIIVKLPDATHGSVVRAMDALERKYGKLFPYIFKTVTVDNGSEFADCAGMEKSCLRKGQRMKPYYCHPYSSWERGSNENQNKLIRRWIPKGARIEWYSRKEIARIERWINDYPRTLYGGKSASDVFNEHIHSIHFP